MFLQERFHGLKSLPLLQTGEVLLQEHIFSKLVRIYVRTSYAAPCLGDEI
jgi:hypothetical protein